MKTNNTDAFIKQAIVKLLPHGGLTVQSVAQELNVDYHTVKNWIKLVMANPVGVLPAREKRPQNWSAQEQLLALHETHGLSGQTLQTGCRERRPFAYPLASWQTVFCTQTTGDSGTREVRALKDENEQLKRDLPC